MSQACCGLPRIRTAKKGTKSGTREYEGEVVSTVWLLPSIMAIWFANGSKRQAEPFLPTISLRFAAGKHSPSLVQSATLKCLESTFAYARANWFYLNPKYESRKASLARHLIALSRIFNRNDRTSDIGTALTAPANWQFVRRSNFEDITIAMCGHVSFITLGLLLFRYSEKNFKHFSYFQLSSLYVHVYVNKYKEKRIYVLLDSDMCV